MNESAELVARIEYLERTLTALTAQLAQVSTIQKQTDERLEALSTQILWLRANTAMPRR
jgi:phage shock protein A